MPHLSKNARAALSFLSPNVSWSTPLSCCALISPIPNWQVENINKQRHQHVSTGAIEEPPALITHHCLRARCGPPPWQPPRRWWRQRLQVTAPAPPGLPRQAHSVLSTIALMNAHMVSTHQSRRCKVALTSELRNWGTNFTYSTVARASITAINELIVRSRAWTKIA